MLGMDTHLWLTIMEGPTPAQAVPIFSTADTAVIRAAADALARRLGATSSPRLLQLARDDRSEQ
jgi:hypothetical protein